jgi:hypothetical protein
MYVNHLGCIVTRHARMCICRRLLEQPRGAEAAPQRCQLQKGTAHAQWIASKPPIKEDAFESKDRARIPQS